MKKYKILQSGDGALTVELEGGISPLVNSHVRRLSDALICEKIPGVYAVIPAYCSLTVCYSPILTSQRLIKKNLKKLCRDLDRQGESACSSSLFHIPVCYGGEFGEDILRVAELTGLSADEIISLHSAAEYTVYMLGFLPGFAYLGGLDNRLHTPRLDSPRTKIPAGSVGTGGEQTGIYPIQSPGGWNLIGRTPIRLYDPSADKPVLLSAGDRIKFYPITEKEYAEIEAQILRGEYTPKRQEVGV